VKKELLLSTINQRQVTLNDERFMLKRSRRMTKKVQIELGESESESESAIYIIILLCSVATVERVSSSYVFTWQHVAKFEPDVQTHYLCMEMARRYWHISLHFKADNANAVRAVCKEVALAFALINPSERAREIASELSK
jgi:hypothetical protein